MVNYETPQVVDAESLWQLMAQIDRETKFTLYETDEREYDLEPLKKLIENANRGVDFLQTASCDEQMIGYLLAQRGRHRRNRHVASVVVGIIADFHNRGIGSALFHNLDQWAQLNQIKRLELTVVETNVAAKRLYQAQGFEVEGVRQRSILLDGRYVNEIYMAKLL
ncbi:GNAT family N-acetyltransferase [Xylocopilactobacillus apis]|uniref:GNAT family N-acetyltransferase n=1 Tax=Xylocopilactobacillus apis TaxID=2932183 RepID=UPI002954F413|nr:GNAT family N-acetyltransferase [Xylocopilactobacillus apis]